MRYSFLWPMDKTWSFYSCRQLDCAFFYKKNDPIVRPILTAKVWTPSLNQYLDIDCVGLGEKGYNVIKDRVIFPVDLYSKLTKIDPRPSRLVSQELYNCWLQLVDQELNRQRRESRKLH